jgi:hypothetical protein
MVSPEPSTVLLKASDLLAILREDERRRVSREDAKSAKKRGKMGQESSPRSLPWRSWRLGARRLDLAVGGFGIGGLEIMRTLLLTLTTCLFVLPAQAKYSGGSGTAQDPYQIATAADLIVLGATPADYDKHFILIADIDLDPNLPGRKVFDKAVLVTSFTGVLDGNGHTISHLTIMGGSYRALFGRLEPGAEIRDLGMVKVNVTGSGACVGGLVGSSGGTVTRCYSTGTVSATGPYVGGLVGENSGTVTQCYSTGAVSGDNCVGGLVGYNGGSVTRCYSVGAVSGTSDVGGLVGRNYGYILHSVWDAETSGLSHSAGGVGLTTAEMRDSYMLGLNGFANDPNWALDGGRDYPRLAWEGTAGDIIPEPDIDWFEGGGTPENPYRIDTARQLVLLGRASVLCDKHLILGADIDLDPNLPNVDVFPQAVIPAFMGVFDGNGHTISHLTIVGGSNLGLFDYLGGGAEVRNLAVVAVNITGSGNYVGGLVGRIGTRDSKGGVVTRCYSAGAVSGTELVGGLVGANFYGRVTYCYSTSAVRGEGGVGGLVASNNGYLTCCYSTGTVSGGYVVGGLVGPNWGEVTRCYSTGAVNGSYDVGGLVGCNSNLFGPKGVVTASFWDTQTSGQARTTAGEGKTTAEMRTAKTFLDAGWDFVGESTNGTEDIWWILEGKDYPRLWWELIPEN